MTLFFASLFALPLSIALLRFYRRAVVRSMRSRTSNSPGSQPASPVKASDPHPTPPDFVAINHLSAAALPAGSRWTRRQLTTLPWMAATIFGVAGLGFGLVTAVSTLLSGHARVSLMRILILSWLYAWPAALSTNLVAATSRRAKLGVVSGYFLVYLVLGVSAMKISTSLSLGEILELWVIKNLFPTILLAIFANRRIRAVGPLMLLLMILGVYGGMAGPFLVYSSYTEPLTRLAAQVLGGTLAFYAAELLGFVFFSSFGWFALQYVRRLYEKKQVSDQMIVLGAVWLMFGTFWFVNLAFDGYVWILGIVPAFTAYLVVVVAGFGLIRRAAGSLKEGRRLLVLRVFSLGKLSERLFDAVAKHWRYVGSIAQIAGPDLAEGTVQPHEFLDFMNGRLARRFIDSSARLDLRLSESDNAVDNDGRFRVNDFFCYEDSWKLVLNRLIRESDAVLMDLRGFSPRSPGCVFEIDELINVVPLERVVFVVDHTTDESYLQATMKESWIAMRPSSPNRGQPQVRFLRFGGAFARDLPNLLTALSAATRANSAGG